MASRREARQGAITVHNDKRCKQMCAIRLEDLKRQVAVAVGSAIDRW